MLFLSAFKNLDFSEFHVYRYANLKSCFKKELINYTNRDAIFEKTFAFSLPREIPPENIVVLGAKLSTITE